MYDVNVPCDPNPVSLILVDDSNEEAGKAATLDHAEVSRSKNHPKYHHRNHQKSCSHIDQEFSTAVFRTDF